MSKSSPILDLSGRPFPAAVAAERPGAALADPAQRPRAGLAALLREEAVDTLVDALTRLPDLDETLARAGITRADLRSLEHDDDISGLLETRREAVVAMPWRLSPWVDEDPSAAWIWDQIEPHLPGLVRDIWQAVPYGYSVVECVYRRTADGRLGIDRLSAKPLEWFEPRRDGGLRWHGPDGDQRELDTAEKFLLTRRLPTYRQPYGEALLSRLYWPWFFATHGWQFWARYVERHAGQFLVGKSLDTDAMLGALTAAVNSAVLAIDRGDDVTAIGQSNAGDAYDRFLAAVSRRNQKVILGQTGTTDLANTGGTLSATQVLNEVRQDRRDSDAGMVADTIQRLVDTLRRRNFPLSAPIRFVLEDERGLDEARAKRDATLQQAGVLALTEQYLLDRYDFVPGDFTVPDPAAAGALNPGAFAALQANATADWQRAARFNRRAPLLPHGAALAQDTAEPAARYSPGQQTVEYLAEQGLAELPQPIPVAQLRRIIAAATDPEDLGRRLALAYRGRGPAYQELLERAIFTADVLGYANAEEGRD